MGSLRDAKSGSESCSPASIQQSAFRAPAQASAAATVPEALLAAALAASEGAEATRGMTARAGRSSYVRNIILRAPVPFLHKPHT